MTLNNTIVAGDTGGDITNSGTLTGSSNLVGDGSGGLTGTITGDPKLGPLAWNGGPTQTMALLAGSPAIGDGAAISVTTDQRGFALDSPQPDIGAFQYQGPPPTATISGPTTGVVQVEGTFTLTATDPTPADQNGTFTYTIDWNGDGTDVQTVQGSASLQVMHAYNATGSYTPIVTVLDQDHRSSSPTALAAPVVVTALTTQIPLRDRANLIHGEYALTGVERNQRHQQLPGPIVDERQLRRCGRDRRALRGHRRSTPPVPPPRSMSRGPLIFWHRCSALTTRMAAPHSKRLRQSPHHCRRGLIGGAAFGTAVSLGCH